MKRVKTPKGIIEVDDKLSRDELEAKLAADGVSEYEILADEKQMRENLMRNAPESPLSAGSAALSFGRPIASSAVAGTVMSAIPHPLARALGGILAYTATDQAAQEGIKRTTGERPKGIIEQLSGTDNEILGRLMGTAENAGIDALGGRIVDNTARKIAQLRQRFNPPSAKPKSTPGDKYTVKFPDGDGIMDAEVFPIPDLEFKQSQLGRPSATGTPQAQIPAPTRGTRLEGTPEVGKIEGRDPRLLGPKTPAIELPGNTIHLGPGGELALRRNLVGEVVGPQTDDALAAVAQIGANVKPGLMTRIKGLLNPAAPQATNAPIDIANFKIKHPEFEKLPDVINFNDAMQLVRGEISGKFASRAITGKGAAPAFADDLIQAVDSSIEGWGGNAPQVWRQAKNLIRTEQKLMGSSIRQTIAKAAVPIKQLDTLFEDPETLAKAMVFPINKAGETLGGELKGYYVQRALQKAMKEGPEVLDEALARVPATLYNKKELGEVTKLFNAIKSGKLAKEFQITPKGIAITGAAAAGLMSGKNEEKEGIKDAGLMEGIVYLSIGEFARRVLMYAATKPAAEAVRNWVTGSAKEMPVRQLSKYFLRTALRGADVVMQTADGREQEMKID